MSIYTLVLLWWDPKDKKVHEKTWNKDDGYPASVFVDKLTTAKKHVVAKFVVAHETGEYAGAW